MYPPMMASGTAQPLDSDFETMFYNSVAKQSSREVLLAEQMSLVPSRTAAYRPGFQTLGVESDPIDLTVEGTLPPWLAGDLVRNGPAQFDAGRKSFRHWFDGQAMLHRFGFSGADGGSVSYTNRFLDTPSLRSARERGRISFNEFATDPCRSIFARFFTYFSRPKVSANASVNVATMDGGARFALTEVPIAVRFDPKTLATVGIDRYEDTIGGDTTTAHPHQDPTTGDLINYVLRFGPRSDFVLYRQRPDSLTREALAHVPDMTPGYVHSFAVTEKYAVLVVFPHVVNPLSFIFRDRPFIENYRWRPEIGTRFVVIGLADGTVHGTYRAEPFFAFHHINAYDDGDEIVIDAASYEDSTIIDALYLDRLRAGETIPKSVPTRYRLDLTTGTVHSRRLSDVTLELPRIDYGRHNGRPYRYAYGSGQQPDSTDFLDRLVKLDVETGATTTWHEPGCYPGEPVFVAAPQATAEDEGVLLSVVLDPASGTSYLLVLAAATMGELARARVPHAVPFGFHGQFTRDVTR